MSEMDKNRNRHQDRKFSAEQSSGGSYNDDEDDEFNNDRKSSNSDNCDYSDDAVRKENLYP